MKKNIFFELKILQVLIIFSLLPLISFSQNTKDSVEFEDIFIHTDKSIYLPGEDIWFKAYILNDESHLPSTKCKVLFFSIIDSSNTIIYSEKYRVKKGFTNGDFHIPNSIKGGVFQIVANTENTQQLPPEFWYRKEIRIGYSSLDILNLSYSQNIAMLPDSILEGEVNCFSSTGFPLKGVKINCIVESNGKKIKFKEVISDSLGKAKINWKIPGKFMKNDLVLNIFGTQLKEKQVLKIYIPLGKQGINISFYPEGGTLVQRLKNRIAFKATDNYGMPIDVKGVILNQKGDSLQRVETYHDGIGVFTLIPLPNESYTFSITSPLKTDSLYTLPKPIESGYTLTVNPFDSKTILVSVSTSYDLVGKQIKLALSNGSSAQSLFETVAKKENRFKISTNDCPIGITALTLFADEKPVAERLVFLNKNKKMFVKIETDKEAYNSRDKVNVSITTLDYDGKPIPANLSLSVSEENKNNNFQCNIFSELLLSSKLSGVDKDLSFYMENSAKADSALNFHLMVYGWRKIQLIETYSKSFTSKNISGIKGHVYTSKKTPAIKATVQLLNSKTWNFLTVETDEQGFFIIPTKDYLLLAQNDNLFISASFPNKKKELTVVLEPDNDTEILSHLKLKAPVYEVFSLPQIQKPDKKNESLSDSSIFTPSEFIEEIVVMGTRLKPVLTNNEMRDQVFSSHKSDANHLKTNTFSSSSMPSYGNSDMSFLEVIRKISPPFQIRDGQIIFRGPRTLKASSEIGALIVLNGVPLGTNISSISSAFTPQDIKDIKVITSPAAGLKYNRPSMGVIEITLLEGKDAIEKVEENTNKNDLSIIKGYKIAREFSAPDYTPSINSNFDNSDIRTTLYWNSNIVTGNNGTQKISFFVGDKKTKFLFRAIGVSETGQLGSSNFSIKIK